MSQTTITTRRQSTDGKHDYASPDTGDYQAICTGYVVAKIGQKVGEFLAFVIDDTGDRLELQRVSGGGDGNYAIYDSDRGAVEGLYIHREALAELGFEDEIPETLGLGLEIADEDDWDEAEQDGEEAVQEEAEALLEEIEA